MPSGFSADGIQRISLFVTPDMSIWLRPASFTILAVCKDTDWPGLQIGNTHHSWKCIFAIGILENWERQTCSWGRRRQSKTAFSLLLKPMMQIFMHEAERNSWVILLPCLKTYPRLKGELITEPKFENVLMSEFCSIYMPSAKSSQVPAYHKSLLSSPSLHPLHWNPCNLQYRTPVHKYVILSMKAVLVKDVECTVLETHILCSIAKEKKIHHG